jgi:cyclic pyranopterin phosphate synthase
MRCVYCHPGGPSDGPRDGELSVDELRLLAECAAAEGVRKLRITGGEPLERDDLEDVVGAVSTVDGIRETCLTTNGVGLAGRAAALRHARLDRVNISLDSLQPDRFALITGSERHAEVLEGIRRAADIFPTVKLNVVLLRGRNDDEAEDFVEFAARMGVQVRFVECYGTPRGAERLEGVPADEVLDRLRERFGTLERLPGDRLSVAEGYRLPGAAGAVVGVIRSASAPPCRRCARLRLTATGELLPCLFATRGFPVRNQLKAGNREGVRNTIRRAYAAKRRDGTRKQRPVCACEVGG